MSACLTAGLLWMMLVCLGTGQATAEHRCPVVSILSVSYLERILIPCPSITSLSDELKYHLYINNSLIHTVQLDFDQKELCGSGVWVNFCRGGQTRTNRFEVTANYTGLYTCKREVVYPPPHKEDCRETVVVVQADQIPELNPNPPSNGSPSVVQLALWAGCAVLLVYSLSITCTTVCIWRKLKREEESEYVNTKPGEFRRPKV